MKYLDFQYKQWNLATVQAAKFLNHIMHYLTIIVLSLLCSFSALAQQQFDIRLELNTVDCAQSTACFDVQLRSADGQNWNLAGQNYRLYYDGNLASFQSGTSELSSQYDAFTLIQDNQNLNASTVGGGLNFEDNLSFLNYHIDLNDLELGGINLPADGSWLTTSQLCFEIDAALINNPNTCLEAIWAQDGQTHQYAGAFVEIAQWTGFCETRPAVGNSYQNLEVVPPSAACFVDICQVDTLDLALFKTLAQPGQTTIAVGGDIVYLIGVVNQGNVAVQSVVITDYLPQETVLSSADNNNWTVANNIATKILEGPLAPGDTLLTPIVLTLIDGSPQQIIFNNAEIVQVQQMGLNILTDIDSTPNEDGQINEDDEATATIMVATCTDTQAPVLENIPNDLVLSCDQNIPLPATPTATDDMDTQVEITFSEQQNGTTCNYNLIRTWTATDDCGNSASDSQTIQIMDNTPPLITPIAPMLAGISSGDTLIMQCGATNLLDDNDAMATDNCDDNPMIELKEGEIIVSSCLNDDFLVWMECYWEATDACGNTSQFWIYIKVIDTTLPTFSTVPLELTIDCGEPISPTLTPDVTDNCSSNANIQLLEQEEIIDGDCEAAMTLIRTWIATDQCGNASSFSQTIHIQDNEAPVILGSPADLTVDESMGQTIPQPSDLAAQDNCDPDTEVIFSQTISQGDCEQTIVRTWTATDDCGNMTATNQTILVLEDCEDCIIPVVAGVNLSPTNCDQSTGTALIDLEANESDYTFTWIPDFGNSTSSIGNARTELPAGTYIVIMNYQGQSDCEEKVELTIEDDCQPTPPAQPDQTTIKANEVVVFSGFSPNGDRINDHLMITGLDDTKFHQLSIFNRWGELVFKSSNYQNDWNGTSDGRDLSDGTYFYILQMEGNTRQTGYIQIHR